MTTDPRLADPLLLVLAAKRCQARRQAPDWRTTVGLSALLDAARALPPREPVDLATMDTSTGLGKMLAEARQRQDANVDIVNILRERDHGA